MYKPKHTPISHLTELQTTLPECFSLICWNLQKVDFSHYLNRRIEDLLDIEEMHILSMQEARIQPQQNSFFGLPFHMSPNIETKTNVYGALTASSHKQKPFGQFLTRTKELGLTTHKPTIITQHPLNNGQTLTHINIHAINFVPHLAFKKELALLVQKIQDIKGPMIFSGDFNTWNNTRLNTLLRLTKQLNLTKVEFDDITPIKTLNRQPLDHIFYRELSLIKSQAINVTHISDHNPIIAKFCLTESHKSRLNQW